MKGTVLFAMALLLGGCASTPAHVEGAISCHHSKDSKLDFSYDVKNVEVWESTEYGVKTFTIKTVDGKTVNYNTYELMNFTCEG